MIWVGLALAKDPDVKVACGGRSPCTLVASADAGVDGDGHALRVLRIALGAGDPAALLAPSRPCVEHEVWGFVATGAKSREGKRLFRMCNDGYGDAGLGRDEVVVSPNAVRWVQSGGTAWQWSTTREVQLSPLLELRRAGETRFEGGTPERIDRWDWTTFSGEVTFRVPGGCGAEASDEAFEGTILPIPRVVLGAETVGAWRDGPFGGCALRVDATGGRGFVVDGVESDAADTGFSVLFGEPTSLWIDVRDDVIVPDGATAVDTVSVWTGPPVDVVGGDCVRPDGAVEWRIPVQGGPARPGYGAPTLAPSVDRVGTRLRIQLPEPPGAISVAYQDTDDGNAVERVLATSDLRTGDARSLGTVWDVPSGEATCVVVDGLLQPRQMPGFRAP